MFWSPVAVRPSLPSSPHVPKMHLKGRRRRRSSDETQDKQQFVSGSEGHRDPSLAVTCRKQPPLPSGKQGSGPNPQLPSGPFTPLSYACHCSAWRLWAEELVPKPLQWGFYWAKMLTIDIFLLKILSSNKTAETPPASPITAKSSSLKPRLNSKSLPAIASFPWALSWNKSIQLC